jgi:hypothetical protein
MTLKNPFSGMNPFFEQQWRDAHSSLITYVRDTLQERLPPDLIARAEEEEGVTVGAGAITATYRPDVQVREPWNLKEPAATGFASASSPPASEPVRVLLEEEVERWVEVRNASGRLITVLELLSPSNKLESGDRERYLTKRRRFIRAGANLVELDLVRQGKPVFPAPVQSVLREAGACYGVCVFRAANRSEQEVYPVRLRDRLPVIRIPLRPADSDVTLDLQALIDHCHERGRYHLLNYRLPLVPPLTAEDAAWAQNLLRQNQLG